MWDSDTIDVGIDLGTTNSAIAVVRDGAAQIVRSTESLEVTASAVWIPKPGVVYVGRKARERAQSDPDNAHAEFKLEMGLVDARRSFARAGLELTPPQLSAEVLKALRADAARELGAAPRAVVITVPAAFTLNQNKATVTAAELAGFDAGCPLVQEPTAAAFAYGFQDGTDRGYWMVFDFGGGTFDAAVVSKRDGDLRVLNHAGDPYLGGKLIDWALVDRVLAPAVADEFNLADFRRENAAWRPAFSKLKLAAEDAKIQLSRLDQAVVMVDLEDGTFEYSLTRGELDALAEPYYTRAINLCRSALREASLDAADIDRVLLVGGATLAPGLRERLADPDTGIGITIDTSLDPITVVARGAAIFASTLRRPAAAPAAAAPGEFIADLAYEPSVTTTRPTVGGRIQGPPAGGWAGWGVTLSNPDGRPPFRSARISLNATGGFATEVDLDTRRTSRFTVELTDGQGTSHPLTPATFTITHRDVEFGGVQLAHSLGIQLADRAFARVLRKGAALPVRAREVFHTADALRRDDPEAVISIPVVQGERDRGDRNRRVGMLEIRPRDVRIDLPAGSEVEVTFEVDASSLVTVVADVPLVQAQFEAEINLDDVRTRPVQELREQLDRVDHRLNGLRDQGLTGEARERLDQLDDEHAVRTARDQVDAAAVDAGAAAAAEDRLLHLQAELDDIEEAAELPTLVARLHEVLAEADEVVPLQSTPADRQELAALHRRAEEAVAAGDPAAVREATDRAIALVVDVQRRSPDWPVRLFFGLVQAVGERGPAKPLVQQGRQAIAERDTRTLDAVNQRLVRLLPEEERSHVIGLRRAS
ncbi:Hsp70 family protein [Dactylosporangium vinaceum]|uniref:Hsp70 family protein n=1 Tax=Dactylosporangium vinaceum TaxID=53362 RepID=A0ABV5MAQ9_9ACTN|nr:Hsp70 family protein [Dactylosporangium vinaceum]UAB92904.1 Hsp70 family protein [Dactylosporangium vinaceum]